MLSHFTGDRQPFRNSGVIHNRKLFVWYLWINCLGIDSLELPLQEVFVPLQVLFAWHSRTEEPRRSNPASQTKWTWLGKRVALPSLLPFRGCVRDPQSTAGNKPRMNRKSYWLPWTNKNIWKWHLAEYMGLQRLIHRRNRGKRKRRNSTKRDRTHFGKEEKNAGALFELLGMWSVTWSAWRWITSANRFFATPSSVGLAFSDWGPQKIKTTIASELNFVGKGCQVAIHAAIHWHVEVTTIDGWRFEKSRRFL